MTEKQKPDHWLSRAFDFITDLKVVVTALLAMGAGGSAMRVMGDAGVTRADARNIADSVVSKRIAPLDTAMMKIFFRQDVMMSDAQKQKADSVMKAALKNITYGGSP